VFTVVVPLQLRLRYCLYAGKLESLQLTPTVSIGRRQLPYPRMPYTGFYTIS